MAANRTVFHVAPVGQKWQVTRDGAHILTMETKNEAMPSQVVIHTRDGQVADEATYQDDPFPPRG